MRKKRIPALLLALCMMLSMAVTAHAAGTTLQVDVPQSLPAVGETFTVTVSIAGNPGLGAVQLALGFDDTVLDCTRISQGSMLRGALSASNSKAEDGARLSAATLDEISGDGTLMTCTFKVLKSGDPAFVMNEIILSTPEGTAVNATGNITSTVVPPVEKPEVNEPAEEPETEPEDEEEVEEEAPAEPEPTKEELLLTEIRDLLKEKNG